MKWIYSILIIFSLSWSFGQSAYFYDSNWQYFYVFNEDALHKAEFLPIQQADCGSDYAVYIRNNNRFVIFTQGEAFDTELTNPRFFAKDNMLAFFVDEQLWTLSDGRPKMIEPWVMDDFAIGDDILCFSNNFDKFMVFQEDSLHIVEFWNVNQVKAGDNLIAYLDNNNQFKVFYYGTKELIDEIPPQSFKVSKNVIAYVSNLGDFMIWDKGDIHDIQYQAPNWYACGEDFVAYVDPMNAFTVYYNGETKELLTYKPEIVQIKDNVMIYTDDFGALYAFYQGEVIRLLSFSPDKVLIDKDIVVYRDNYGYLKGMHKGQKQSFSQEIAIDFDLFNSTLVYKPDRVKWIVFNDGKYYKYP